MANKKIEFEAALESLELEVRKLEVGNMSLEEALDSYEKAIKLVKVCNSELESAQRRVRILVEDASGSVTDVDFNGIESDAT